jgi:hypothetical protein
MSSTDKSQNVIGALANICRGGCGIAIFGVHRDKSQYLAFTAINRDFCGFPRQIAIPFTFYSRIPEILAF